MMSDRKAQRPARDRRGSLNRGAAIPLYHQIFLTLRDEITRGERPFGSALPTEIDLAARYKVSRITARRALDELANLGLVDRRRRLGTRVIHRTSARPIEANIDQALESLIAFGQNTAVKVIELTTETADARTAAKLGLAEGEAIVRAVRVRSTKDGPLGLIISYIPAGLGIPLTADALTEAPILSLVRAAGIVIGGAVQTIEAMVADPALATNLGIEPRAAVLLVERQVEDADGRIVLVTNAFYRADRYRITLDMHEAGRILPKYA